MARMASVRDFIVNYSPGDEARVGFAWNGKHGTEFRDGNLEFRQAVLGEVLDRPEGVPAGLLRDLFRAETECAREAWGVSGRIGELALLLLTVGGPDYIVDYPARAHAEL